MYFKVTVICDYSIDFHETFTDFDGNDESLGTQNPVYIYILRTQKVAVSSTKGKGFFWPTVYILTP